MKAIGLLLLFFCIFFVREIFFGQVFACCDNFLTNIPIKQFILSELQEGRFPLWNPFMYSGTPLLADINLSVLSPFSFFYLFLPAIRALTWNIMFIFLFASFGMYMFGRSLGLQRISALVAAVTFSYSGSLMVLTDDLPGIQPIAFLPWIMWAWHTYIQHPSVTRGILVTVLSAMQIFSGHPHVMYMTWLLSLAYIVNLGLRSVRSTLVLVSPVLVLVGLVTAVQTLPFIEYVLASTRPLHNMAFAASDSLSLLSVVRFFVPSVGGVLAHATAWWEGGNVNGYIGIVAFLLAFFSSGKNRELRFFRWVAAIAFLIALGRVTPLFSIAYWIVPGFSFFRSPQNYLVLYAFAMAVLAGFGMQQILDKHIVKANVGLLRLIGMVVAGLGALLFTVWFIRPIHLVFMETAVNLLVSGTLVFVFSMVLRKNPLRQYAWIVLFLIITELCLFSRNIVVTTPMATVSAWLSESTRVATQLTDFDWRSDRVHVDPSMFVRPNHKDINVEKTSAWNASILWPNLTLLYQLPSTGGTGAMSVKSYQEYLESDPKLMRTPYLTHVPLNKLNDLGVRYIVGNKYDAKLYESMGIRPVMEAEHSVLYKNSFPLPRLFLKIDSKIITDAVGVITYEPNVVEAQVRSPAAGTVVFMDSMYPGWEVYVNGEKKQLQLYDNAFKSVAVSAGTHRVQFVFRPISVRIGFAITIIGTLMLVCCYISVIRLGIRRVINTYAQ